MQKVFFPCLFVLVSLLAGTVKAQTSVRASTYPLLAMWSFRELAQMPTTPQEEATPTIADSAAALSETIVSSETTAPVETPAETPAPSETPAPAEISVSFSTERLGTGAMLKWNLSQRDDVTSVVIEASEDGEVFTDLEALQNAEAAAMNVYYDAEPNERRFYRIVANYKDGRQHITPAGNILPPPPPVPDFTAGFESENGDLLTVRSAAPVEIYDLTGKRIFTATLEEGVYVIDLLGLPANEHYLVRSGDHKQMVFYRVEIPAEASAEGL